MPELPEVETVRRGLAPAMEGQRIEHVALARADLRKPFPNGFAKRLTGRTITRLDRRAKYILVHLDSGDSAILHLGMSGSFRIEKPEGQSAPGKFHYARGTAKAHDHVTLMLGDGTRVIYNDPRRFGSMDVVPTASLDTEPPLKGLGIEPLSKALTPRRLTELLDGRRTAIKAALLDQRIIAGLGNIYVCEALWQAGISPFRLAGDLGGSPVRPSAMTKRLAEAIPDVLRSALKAGGSTLRNYSSANGELGYFQHQFRVYDREGQRCPKPSCGLVERVVQNGRSTFWCPKCQK